MKDRISASSQLMPRSSRVGGFYPTASSPGTLSRRPSKAPKGRRILFLDTCHAGNSYNQRLSSDSYETNVIVYSAARWDQEALSSRVSEARPQSVTAAGQSRRQPCGIFWWRVAELASKLGHQQELQNFHGRDAMDYVLVGAR